MNEHLQEELHLLMKRLHAAHEIKLLNVGSDAQGEYHWRFRAVSGQIFTLKMETEERALTGQVSSSQ
jgi:hypothetical protein